MSVEYLALLAEVLKANRSFVNRLVSMDLVPVRSSSLRDGTGVPAPRWGKVAASGRCGLILPLPHRGIGKADWARSGASGWWKIQLWEFAIVLSFEELTISSKDFMPYRSLHLRSNHPVLLRTAGRLFLLRSAAGTPAKESNGTGWWT